MWGWGNELFTKIYDNLERAYKQGEEFINSACNSIFESFQWIWEALQGDFNQDRTAGQIAADAVLGIIPIVDQVLDVRDLIANCMHINNAKKDEDTTPHWIAFGLTLVGFIPSLGSIAKGILKIILLMARKVGGNIGKALKPALVPIKMFLNNPKVKRIFPNIDYSKMLLEAAKHLEAVKDLINVPQLTKMLAEALDNLKSIIGKVKHIAPDSTVRWLNMALSTVTQVQKQADKMLEPALKPIQNIIDKVVAFLRKEADESVGAVTNSRNIITVRSAVADVDPKILSRTKKGIYGEIISDEFMRARGHTQLLPVDRYARTMDDVPKGRGMDGFYRNSSPPPTYIVTETKFRTMEGKQTKFIDSDGSISDEALLGNAQYGKQMSDGWVNYHVNKEFVNNPELRISITQGDYLAVLFLVDEKGAVVAAQEVLANGSLGRKLNLETLKPE